MLQVQAASTPAFSTWFTYFVFFNFKRIKAKGCFMPVLQAEKLKPRWAK